SYLTRPSTTYFSSLSLHDALPILLLSDHDQLKLHCWHERQGITLEYRESPQPTWAAHAAVREPGELVPKSLEPIGTDGGRYRRTDRKSTRLNSSHQINSYAVFCLK